jgi:hypothetical protein
MRVPVQFGDGTIFPQPQMPSQGQATDHQDNKGDQPGQDQEEDPSFISPLERLEQRLEQQRTAGGAQLAQGTDHADQSITITRGDLDRIAEQVVARLQGVPAASQGLGVAPAQPSMFPPFPGPDR